MSGFTTIKVPIELRDRVKAIADKLNKPQWQVVLEAVSFYEYFLKYRSVRESVSNLEKVSWYITKIATSFGAFKENPTPENFELLKKRIEELEKRLEVDGRMLLRLAEYYMNTQDEEIRRKLRMDLNAAFKMLVKDILIIRLFNLVLDYRRSTS